MIRLKGRYKGKAALNIMGGPSIIENRYDLSLIDKNKYTVFLESKALTPRFLQSGISPDFYMAFFPEKCQTNSFQQVVCQSFKAGIDLSGLLKEEYLGEYRLLKKRFNEYFEVWKPEKGAHKKFRLKNEVFLINSPFSLLSELKASSVITNRDFRKNYLALCENNSRIYEYSYSPLSQEFSLNKYFSPFEEEGRLMLNTFNHTNSAAIALFPLQYYMGFSRICFLGMDMSMFGSMEYSSIYTFRSLRHFAKFFKKAMPAFGAAFKPNAKKFMRPEEEFINLKELFSFREIEFINIYETSNIALPVEGARNITFREFLHE